MLDMVAWLNRRARTMRGHPGKCVIPDDMQEIYSKMLEADGIIFGSPVYFWGVTAQAKALSDRLKAAGKRIDCVLSLEAPEQTLVNRLAGRYTCPNCNMSFNRFYRPAWVAGICDNCGAALGQRADDTENTVRQRLKEYVAKTSPVLAFFKAEAWPVRTIESVGEVEQIFQRIRLAVEV
jgi:adenylate kinase